MKITLNGNRLLIVYSAVLTLAFAFSLLTAGDEKGKETGRWPN